MIRFFLAILLMSAICSCRSSRQSATEYVGASDVVVDFAGETLTNDEILSLITSSREFDLSGIKVEFFPPDSAHPSSRAAPKSIEIESAKAKESSEQSTHEQMLVDEQKTVNLSAQSSKALQQNTRSNNDLLRPADWVVLFSILGAILILSLILIIKTCKNDTLQRQTRF